MPTADPATLAARLARLADDVTDADLLARYSRERDGAAFTELVRRHGPAVLAACRRLTQHAHDADDAFQATFLVLARKAHRLRPEPPLGGWLYAVAVRAARKAKERSYHRREVSGAVPDVPERPTEPVDPDAARAVIEEVERLSPWYRAAVVLCELEGRSRAAAARELGVAEGTLSSRLAAARKQLAARLTARGFGPVLVLLAGVAVPPDLMARAAALASGEAQPAAVAALAHEVLRTMLFRKLLPIALVVAVIACAVTAAGLAAPQPLPVATPAAGLAPAAPVPAPPAPVGPNRLFFHRAGELKSLGPDGRDERTALTPRVAIPNPNGPPGREIFSPRCCAVSPDGKRLAGIAMQPAINVLSSRYRQLLVVRGLGPDGWRDDLTIDDLGARGGFFGGDALVWSGDGTRLAVSLGGNTPRRHDAKAPATMFAFDLATKARTPLGLPDDATLTDWSRDGRRALTTPSGLWELSPDGRRPLRPAADWYWQEFQNGVFSPDGKRMLATGMHGTYEVRPEEKAERERLGLSPTRPPIELFVTDLDTGKATPVKDMPPNAAVESFCWSPDGRRIAYVWRVWTPRWPVEVDGELYHLTVCDADGSNARTVLSTADQLGNVNWR